MSGSTETVRRINYIRNLNFQEIEIDYLSDLISELMKNYNTVTQRLSARTIYRARLFHSHNTIKNISELWYPPEKEIKKLGRLNRINQSIFYCSADPDTATLELRPKVGDTISILKCESKYKLHVMQLGMKELDVAFESNFFGPFRSRLNSEDNLLIHQFLVEEFTKKVNEGYEFEYKSTIAIAEIFLKSDQIHGLWYPSIAISKGSNLGIKPGAVDKFYTPTECWTIRVEKEVASLKYEVLCVNKAKSIKGNGRIIW